jgi:ferredoxin
MGTLRQSEACRCDSRRSPATAGRPGDTARARAMVYQALAEVLAGPTPGIQDLLLEAVMAGAQSLDSVACQQAALTLADLPTTGLEALQKSYRRLIANPGHRPLALYESLHYGGGLMGQVSREVERYYRALGLAPLDGELPDHASVELAFMGHLARAEAEARDAGDGRLRARLRGEQRNFLSTHPAAWLPEVGVALATAGDPFYAAVGRLLGGFLAEELAGRQRNGQTGVRFPALTDPAACTLCGLCVGSCPLGALQVIESTSETALTLNRSHCVGCNRCWRTCPEGALRLSFGAGKASRSGAANGTGHQVLRQSPRTACPNCGRPTVSQAELDAVLARLQPDPAMQQRLYLCVECKSWSA